MADKITGNRTARKTQSTKKPSQSPPKPGPVSIKTGSSQPGTTSISPANVPATQLHPGIEEEIRQRAYELYVERGRQDGFEAEDWARAETEILGRYQREKSA